MTGDLVAFLRRMLDAEAEAAQAAIDSEFVTSGKWDARGPYGDDDRYGNIRSELNEQIIEEDLLWPVAAHIARHDPARVLRRVEAEREIVDVAEGFLAGDSPLIYKLAMDMLTGLAAVYADHPDYREEWRP